ncbi:MAG: peptide chain release factor N(5)-glutamine methyltransferase [Candidatus Eisenbacteria bacterium]|nr:peptide chain release factor N(5)-glutamine methyltransferase [Candidatus Latescibacterota bacterium]MBD3303208.1 peptide chain release factor N(5)-glutamine methyltransferase [Candidatus Eisenbacteria bacterium]
MTAEPRIVPNPLFIWIRDAAERLRAIGAGNPRLEAEHLMAAAIGIPRIRLWLRDEPPAEEEIARFEALLARRLAREPLQYVLGTAEFCGTELRVGPGLFIPRSETEQLVETAAVRLERMFADGRTGPRIADVGTGTGAILLALLRRLPGATGVGIDRSAAAVETARHNAERLGLEDRCRFTRGDLLAGVEPDAFDAVVSNPPYIAEPERAALAPEIRDHEPEEALFSGAGGLDAIRRLIPQAARVLPEGGLLALEIGIEQSEAVVGLLDGSVWDGVEVVDDLTRRPRIVTAVRSRS